MDPPAVRPRDPWPWVGVACGAAFLLIAWIVNGSGGLAFDDPLATAIRGLPLPVGFWEVCTALGGFLLIPLGAGIVLAALLSGRVRLAIILAVVLLGAALFTEHVKDFVARPRPPGEPLVPAPGYSFPSGHTLNSTVTYGLLALVAWRSRLPLTARRLAVAVGVIVPVLVGSSRIALGVHYPSDVLAGWLAGIAFVALGASLIRMTGAMQRDLPRSLGRRPSPGP